MFLRATYCHIKLILLFENFGPFITKIEEVVDAWNDVYMVTSQRINFGFVYFM